MRSRRTSTQHQEAVSQRLALLSAHLAEGRGRAADDADDADDAADAADAEGGVTPAAGGEWWAGHTRVTALHAVPEPPAPPPAPPDPPAPVRIPVPGRHAARRRAAPAAAALLPETLRGRVGLAPAGVVVVALLAAVALALAAWQVLRDDPPPPVATGDPPAGDLVPVVADGPTPTSSVSAGAGAAVGTVTVDVAGRVRQPGIVVLDAGARVVDALDEAGGARAAVDLSALNLARVLVDGEQILVGASEAPASIPTAPEAGGSTGSTAPSGSSATTGAPATPVSLNSADQATLETLPDVGPVTAAAIIAWREEHGGFSAVTELIEVTGIGEVTLAQLTPLVTV